MLARVWASMNKQFEARWQGQIREKLGRMCAMRYRAGLAGWQRQQAACSHVARRMSHVDGGRRGAPGGHRGPVAV